VKRVVVRALNGPCPDCGDIVKYTKRGRPYPAHRASKGCLEGQTCTCGHLREEHADEKHECAAFDPGDYDGAPDVKCACITYERIPRTERPSRRAGRERASTQSEPGRPHIIDGEEKKK
jgi:hypothetical protein